MKKYIISALVGLTVIVSGLFGYNTGHVNLDQKKIGGSVLFPYQGGTGTSTVPNDGDILLALDGIYRPVTTSSLGISGGAGTITTSSEIIHNDTSGIQGGGFLHSSQLTETTSTPEFAGLTLTNFTGLLLASSGVISTTTNSTTEWNTAYGWGNHADAGYLTSESDPYWLASSTEYARLAIKNTFTNTTTMASGTATFWDVGVLAINGANRSQYFIDGAGVNGQLWQSDGSGSGQWVNTSSLGFAGSTYTAGDGLDLNGTVFAVDIDTTLTTTTGVLGLPGVGTAGTYGNASTTLSITTDAQGRITSITTSTYEFYDYAINSVGTAGQFWGSDGSGRGSWFNTSTIFGSVVPLAFGGTGAALTSPTAGTSTYLINTAGTTYLGTLATSTIARIAAQSPTTTAVNGLFGFPVCPTKRSIITQISGVNISTSSPSYAIKLWSSTDITGDSASTTIGTYVMNNTTTPDVFNITPAVVDAGSCIMIGISGASSTVASSLNLWVGGYFE